MFFLVMFVLEFVWESEEGVIELMVVKFFIDVFNKIWNKVVIRFDFYFMLE